MLLLFCRYILMVFPPCSRVTALPAPLHQAEVTDDITLRHGHRWMGLEKDSRVQHGDGDRNYDLPFRHKHKDEGFWESALTLVFCCITVSVCVQFMPSRGQSQVRTRSENVQKITISLKRDVVLPHQTQLQHSRIMRYVQVRVYSSVN